MLISQWIWLRKDFRIKTSQGHDGFPSNSFWTVYRPKQVSFKKEVAVRVN